MLTAAHCLCDLSGEIEIVDPNDTNTTVLGNGQAFIHSSYTCPSTGHAPHDIALVLFTGGTPIVGSTGVAMNEFFRPVWSTDPSTSSTVPFGVFGAGGVNEYKLDGFCGENPINNDDSLKWGNGVFDNAPFGNIGTWGGLDPGHTVINEGDSGGPWMTAPSITESDLLNNGVVAGTLALSSCSTDWFGYEAASTFDSSNLSFLQSTMGGELSTVDTTGWTRTCWLDWCIYTDSQKASLLSTILM